MFPCIGSHCQITWCPVACTFSMIAGSTSRTLALPIRETSVSLPGLLFGSSRSTYSTAMSGVVDGPIFSPIGFASNSANAMCAPSS